MIDVQGLSKWYGAVAAVDNVSFRLAPGEVVGFLGPNGAGKTTTLRMLTGVLTPTRGRVTIAEHAAASAEAKRSLGYVPETPPIYPELTVREYLTYIGRLKALRGESLAAEITRAVERLGLEGVVDRLLGQLSKGFQQRCALAQGLLGRPPVLILDEPTVGLDPRQVADLRVLLGELAGEHTVLLSTHSLPEVKAICRRVMIIHRGRLVADTPLDDLARRYGEKTGHASLAEIFLALTEG